MRRYYPVVLALVGLLLGGCFDGDASDERPPPQPATNPPAAPTTTFRSLYLVSGGLVPYPNDLFFQGSTDGTLNLPLLQTSPNNESLNALDGYSTTARIQATFSGAIDGATLVGNVSVWVIEVLIDPATTATIGFATPNPVDSILAEGVDYDLGLAPDLDAGDSIIRIKPLRPLNASSGYLVIVTNGVTDPSGTPAAPGTDYQTIKEALATGATIPDPTLDGVKQLIGAHFLLAGAILIDPADIIVSFSFQTQSTTNVMEQVDAITTAQVALIQFTGLTTMDISPLLMGKADVYAGIVQVVYYLDAANPLTGNWEAAAGGNPLDPASTHLTRLNPVPVATATLSIPALVTLPNINSMFGATPPPEGWSTAIFLHGITRDRSDMFAVADAMADAGFAVIAIDQPLHGITDTTSLLYQPGMERTFDLDLVNNVDGSPGPDGEIDSSGTHFINLTSPLTSRDNQRQAAADVISVGRTIPTIDLDADTNPDLNGDRIYFIGHSLGAVNGITALGVSTDARAAFLSAPGGVLTDLLIESPTFGPVIEAGLVANGLIPDTTLYNQFLRDVQTIVDAGDPINYAALAAGLHPILMHEVVGDPAAMPPVLPDQVVPNNATERLVAEMGLNTVSTPGPNLESRGIVRFLAGSHGSLLSPAASLAVTVEMQTQMATFLGSDGTVVLISDPTVVQ